MPRAGSPIWILAPWTARPCWSVTNPSTTEVVCAGVADAQPSRNALAHSTLRETLRRRTFCESKNSHDDHFQNFMISTPGKANDPTRRAPLHSEPITQQFAVERIVF